MSSGRSEKHQLENADPIAPPELARALSAFARHDSAVRRHLDLLARLRTAQRENEALRASMERLDEHNRSAAAEMLALRAIVSEYTQTLRSSGLPPERALVVIRTSVTTVVSTLPTVERPQDVVRLASDLVQCAIRAYYAA